MSWYRTAQSVGFISLCYSDLTLKQIIQERSSHKMSLTQSFQEGILPYIKQMINTNLLELLKPLEKRYGKDYLFMFWKRSFSKLFTPRESPCRGYTLELYVKGDWATLATMFLEKAISFSQSLATRKETIINKILNENGQTTTDFYRTMQNDFDQAGIPMHIVTVCVRQNRPDGVNRAFMRGDYKTATNMIINYYAQKDEKKSRNDSNYLIYLYDKIVSPSILLYNVNFTIDNLKAFLYHKQKYVKTNYIQYEQTLRESIEKQDWDRATDTIERWIRTIPKFIFPIIYKEYVINEIPGWPYQSFYNSVKNNAGFIQSVINDDKNQISQWISEYKKRRQDTNPKKPFYDDSRYYADPNAHRSILPPPPNEKHKTGPRYSPPKYLEPDAYRTQA